MSGFGEGQHAERGCCGDSMRRPSHRLTRVEFIKRHTERRNHSHIDKVAHGSRRDFMNELVEFAFACLQGLKTGQDGQAQDVKIFFGQLDVFLALAEHFFRDIEFNEQAFLEALLGKELVKSYVLYRTSMESRVVSREADGRVGEPGDRQVSGVSDALHR